MDLNASTDAYPLARPSQAAAIATIEHRPQILDRIEQFRAWKAKLAGGSNQWA